MNVLDGGRRIDTVTGEVQPWYTHAALDEIHHWSLDGKVVLEWGGGYSSLWWARRCKWVFTVENQAEWCQWISKEASARGLSNLSVVLRPSSLSGDEFTRIPEGCTPDIVVIDGAHRFECLAKTLTLPRPLSVIFDNWRKGEPWRWYGAEALMGPYLGVSYAQHDTYVGHEPWQTAIWHLPASTASSGIAPRHPAPRRQVLATGWDGIDIERDFAENIPGLAVIDEVLTDRAIEELHRFYLDSTNWSPPRHPHLRAWLEGSARHPILDQVAEELTRRLPCIIGNNHPLRAIFGERWQPTHAAESGMRRHIGAVSVVLWIMPATRSDTREGLVLYDVSTPHRVHDTFESRKADVEPGSYGLRRTNAVTVPYRQNRALVFNTDLLHEGPLPEVPASFTLLYGYRQSAATCVKMNVPARASALTWRSAAFGKARRA